jgi:hypothetical protein
MILQYTGQIVRLPDLLHLITAPYLAIIVFSSGVAGGAQSCSWRCSSKLRRMAAQQPLEATAPSAQGSIGGSFQKLIEEWGL